MGSFNVSCGLSSLPISNGDRTGIILLQKNQYEHPKAGYLMTTYPTDLFLPYYGIVYGKYDSYGTTGKFEKTPSLAMIENKFGMEFKRIIEVLRENDRSIYSEYGGYLKAFGKKDLEKAFGYEVKRDITLTKLGFNAIITDAIYTIRDYTLTVHDDHNWTIQKEGGEAVKVPYGHDLPSFVENLGKILGFYPGFTDEETAKVNLLKNTSGMFFNADLFDKLKETKFSSWDSGGMDKFDEDWDKWLERTSVFGDDLRGIRLSNNEFLSRQTAMTSEDIDAVLADGAKETFKEVKQMTVFLTMLGRSYQPGIYMSETSPNIKLYETLYSFTTSAIDKIKKEYGDEDEDG